MIRAFIRDSSIYMIPAVVSRGLSIILVPLYTRVLTPADYGALDMLMAFGSIVNITVALEISQGVARYYADEKDPDKKIQYASTAFWFTCVAYTLFLALGLIFSSSLARLVMGVPGLEGIFRLGMLYLWMNGLFYLIQNQFRWELRSTNYAVVSLLLSFVTAGVAIILAYGLKWGLTGLLLGMIAGCLVSCLYGLWHLRNSFRLRFQGTCLKEMLLFSAPLVPSGIAVFVSMYIDRLMINHYLSLNDVGLYGVGFRLASIVGLVMVGFQGALTPLIYTHYQERETPPQLALIFRVFIAFALLFFLLMSVFAREILWLMTTPAYYSAARLVVFLVPAILFSNMYIFAPGIGIGRKTQYILWINVAGALFMLTLNWVMIPSLGIMGAAMAKLIGYAAVFAAYMFFSQRLYPVPHTWLPLGLSLVCGVALAWWGAGLDYGLALNLLLKGLLLVALCVLIMATGLIRVTEIERAYVLAKQRLLRTA